MDAWLQKILDEGWKEYLKNIHLQIKMERPKKKREKKKKKS